MSVEREIIEIPARIDREDKRLEKLRVAAYCRVSTNQEAQQNSYQAQKAYYLEMIESHPNWVLADIFADEGASGTSVDRRTEFQRMIRWCKRGKIDLILTKSISRFARNTEDCLHYVRMLKTMQIPVIFETERLDTSQMDGEFFLAMLGANSQAESEMTSNRIKWGVQAAFRRGKVRYQYKRWLGYRKGEDGEPKIVPEEAKIVKQIYDAYLSGKSLQDIKFELESGGIPTKTGLSTWSMQAILNILQNEKYTGDALLQKTFTTDPISKSRKKNQGELPQYLIKHCHPAIISQETFDLVQKEIVRRSTVKASETTAEPPVEKTAYSGKYALSGIMVCGGCNSLYRRCTWKRNGKTRIVWRCQNRLKNGTKFCESSPTIEEADLHRVLTTAMNEMLYRREYLLKPFEDTGIATRCQDLAEQLRRADEALIEEIMMNANQQVWNGDVEPFRNLVKKRREYSADVTSIQKGLPDHLEEYSDAVARLVLEKIVVLDGGCLRVIFKGGAATEQSF